MQGYKPRQWWVVSLCKREREGEKLLPCFSHALLSMQREEEMRAPLLSTANAISKPSIRRHSSSENLSGDHHHLLHQHPQDKQTFPSSPPPSLPSRHAHSTIYTCIAIIIIFFFFITIVGCLHCSNIDPHHVVKHSKGQIFAHPSRVAPALKGLGTVYIRGTKAMSELIVAHITEDTQMEDLKLFLRTLYRSGIIARADIVLLYPWNALPVSMVDVVHEENHSFHKLLRAYTSAADLTHDIANSTSPWIHASSNASISPFNINAYQKANVGNEVSAQPFWGVRIGNFSCDNRSDDEEAQQLRWGSVIGFDASELNPDDTLHGFLDRPPVMLRRWACYQMLLGMVRHRFKHVLLTDVSGAAFLGDPFAMARKKMGLYLALEDRAWGVSSSVVELGISLRLWNADSDVRLSEQDAKHNRVTSSASSKAGVNKRRSAQVDVHQRGIGGQRRFRKGTPVGGLYERVYGKRMWSGLEDCDRTKKLVNSGAIMGGIHQVRGLANAMVTEIVKVALERTNRDAFPDSVLLSYLLHKSSSVLGKRVLEHLNLLDNAESFVHSLSRSQQSSFFFKRSRAVYPMIHGNHKSRSWFVVAQAIHYDICASPADAMVYIDDCIHTQASRKVFVNTSLKFL